MMASESGQAGSSDLEHLDPMADTKIQAECGPQPGVPQNPLDGSTAQPETLESHQALRPPHRAVHTLLQIRCVQPLGL